MAPRPFENQAYTI